MALRWIDLDLERNEASDCLPLVDEDVLAAHGWDLAYWILLDEDHLDDAIGVIGHRAGGALDEGWEHEEVPTDCGRAAGTTDDTEAVATHDGWVYAFGSHFGSKRGPLQRRRHWLARWHEDALPGAVGTARLPVQVLRDKLRLHRMLNDALAPHAGALVGVDERLTEAFVRPLREEGERRGKRWASRLRDGDWPLNVEGAAFRPDGSLLLGLRFPTQVTGAPVLVELAGVPRAFEEGGWPVVTGVWLLEGPGSPSTWTGIRAMTTRGDDVFDVVVGNLDAVDKDALLLDCHPEGRDAVSEHWRFSLQDRRGSGTVRAERVSAFDGETRIEGIAHAPEGHFVYVVDEDHRVHVKFLGVERAA